MNLQEDVQLSTAHVRIGASKYTDTGYVVGIDATNLRQGGGRTHLIELLRAAHPHEHDVKRVIVWAESGTLDLLDDRAWLTKVKLSRWHNGTVRQALWQRLLLPGAVRAAGCDLLFVPGGRYAGGFRPVVTMCRNMLPFEWQELRRFGWSSKAFRLLLLRYAQTRTFRRAEGIIFLTRFAQRRVLEVTGTLEGSARIISHGLNSRFLVAPRPQQSIDAYSPNKPYRILYVSIINQYKHQWHVVRAVAQLREDTRWPLALDLVGPAYPPALKRLEACIGRLDPKGVWVKYHGEVPYADLHQIYSRADLGVFASSCENMPNILLETMAAGLPLACSNRGPMPEILRDAGVYFDPQEPEEIADALKQVIASPGLRTRNAMASYTATKAYSWARCAADTFEFLSETVRRYRARAACSSL